MPSEREILSKRTLSGGWTKETLAEWGVSWPPQKGWKERLINEDRLNRLNIAKLGKSVNS